MIDELRPYPAYSDSGVSWLGEVPGHWDVRQLGCFGLLTKVNGASKEDEVPEGRRTCTLRARGVARAKVRRSREGKSVHRGKIN